MSNKNFESRSLNTSFTCNYNFGISEKIDKDNQNTFSVKRNNNTKHFMTQNEKDDLKLNLNNSKENGNNEIKNNNIVVFPQDFMDDKIRCNVLTLKLIAKTKRNMDLKFEEFFTKKKRVSILYKFSLFALKNN